MRRSLFVVLLALVAASFAAPAHAQFQFRGIEFWGGQYAWSGEQTDRLDAGFRGGFGIYGELSPSLGIGLEGVTGGFDSDSDDVQNQLRWDDVGVNTVARLALRDRSGVHPFVEARFGWTRIETAVPSTTEGQVVVIKEDGLSYGGEIGLEIPLNRRARIVLAGGLTHRDYGDAELDGASIPGTEFSGNRWGLRFGISLGRSVD